jgi:alpha-ketoglutarate-dependent taurine dioxygenase
MSTSDLENMLCAFNRYGFVILACDDITDSREDLLALKLHLGNAAPHMRADTDGIVQINAFSEKQGFLGSSAERHLPHTDGAFSDNPELITALQCITPATQGGVSQLASAQAAYTYLATSFPERVHELSRPDALTIRRGTQTSTQPVFLHNNRYLRIRFRMPDGAAKITPHPEVYDLFNELSCFLTKPENILELELEKGQVLIVDNTALVHGRTSYAPNEPRNMRRLNFDASGPLCTRMIFGFTWEELNSNAAGEVMPPPTSI